MNSVGSGGECHVDARVYHNHRSVRIRKIEGLPRNKEQIPRRKIFLADLNPFDAIGQITGDIVDQDRAGGQTAAVGDIAADEATLHSRKHALSV